MNRLVTDEVKAFLELKARPDLARLYSREMELQVLPARDDGERCDDGEYKGSKALSFTDGDTVWYPIRIPKNPSSVPEDNTDQRMNYDICAHAEGVGMTGWNWVRKRSIYVAFDFDAIAGHSDRHKKKLTNDELAQVTEKATQIPWVTVRKSASGSGLHLYVFLDLDVEVANHSEHAAIARSVLNLMSGITGYDFSSRVDVCGSNIWVWHRKCIGKEHGFELVKQGETLKQIPEDWRSHLKVVTGARKTVLPEFVDPGQEDEFDELCGQHPRVKLDEKHKELIEWMQKNEGFGSYSSDLGMLITHTWHLKRAHTDMKMKGVFETSSPHTNPGEQNCFAFPLRNGAWAVRRYSKGTAEAPTWEQDSSGYTKCYLNRDPDLRTAAVSNSGNEAKKGGFAFTEANLAAKAARQLGANIELPVSIAKRAAHLSHHKDGRLILEVAQADVDNPTEMTGWHLEKKMWTKILSIPKENATIQETDVGIFDKVVRHTVSSGARDAGWFVKADGQWNFEPGSNIVMALMSLGQKKTEAQVTMGACIFKPWTLVNRPFEPEYTGGRDWNKDAAQLLYPVSEEFGPHPTWDALLNQVGRGLDEAIKTNPWALANSIKTGGEYLKLWMACVIQEPYSHLPYLFLWSKENKTGKSMFHEAWRLLISRGIVNAGNAITSKGNFNGELETALICYIEEINLRKDKAAYDKVKDWVTSPYISIHKKNQTPYDQPNLTKFIHTSNVFEAFPIFPGDTRVTVIHVPPPEKSIPKHEFIEALTKEAPHFLSDIATMDIPATTDRLRIPCIDTSEKHALSRSNESPLEAFIANFCFKVPGQAVLFSEFYDKFINTLDEFEKNNWSKIRVSRALPPDMPVGNLKGTSTRHIGNVSFEDVKSELKPLVVNERDILC